MIETVVCCFIDKTCLLSGVYCCDRTLIVGTSLDNKATSWNFLGLLFLTLFSGSKFQYKIVNTGNRTRLFKVMLFFAVVLSFVRFSECSYIYTFAGNGIPGHSDGKPAENAELQNPLGVAVFSNSAVYIADRDNNRIRIVHIHGMITTFAGNGSAGYSGDGRHATSAELKSPSGVTVSSTHEVYIADTGNNRIRVVFTNGTITTFSGTGSAGYSGDGGLAVSAELHSPSGVAVSSTGEVYIADTGNNCTRVVFTNGTITTFSGTGSAGYSGDGGPATNAELNHPRGVAVSSTGEVYIADTGNNRIRVVFTNGTITTFSGSAGHSGDAGLAVSSELKSPSGVAVSSTGEVYIADTGNNRIRVVFMNGIIATLAGNGIPGYFGDGRLATSAELYSPSGVAVSSTGEVYIADSDNNRIRLVVNSTSSQCSDIGYYQFQNYCVCPNGIMNSCSSCFGQNWISQSICSGHGNCISYNKRRCFTGVMGYNCDQVIGLFYYPNTFSGNGSAGYSGDGGPATSAELYSPYGVSVSSNCELYIADTSNNVIRVVFNNGTIATFAGTDKPGYFDDRVAATKDHLNKPSGVAVSPTGEVYIADTDNNRIIIVFTNGTITNFAGNGHAGDFGDGKLATSAELRIPSGVAISLTGGVYIADTGNSRIRIVFTNGTITTFAGNGSAGYSGDGGPATNAELNHPRGVAVSSTDEVYIADTLNKRIRVVFTNGTINTFAGNGNAGYFDDGGPAIDAELRSAWGVAVSLTGEVYIADTFNNRIRIVFTNGTITTFTGNGIAGYFGDRGPATNAELNRPRGVSISSAGEVYVADSGNNAIRSVTCIPGFSGQNCQFSICFGISGSMSNVCSGHGNCTLPNNRQCNNGYTGHNCQLSICYGINETNSKVCSDHGKCISPDNRQCNNGYTGHNCQLSICYGINETNSKVCSGHGKCISPDNRQCKNGYTGHNCQLSICYGINETNSKVCSGHGKCISPDNRVCSKIYEGNKCERNRLRYLGLLVLLIPIVILLAMITILFIWLFKRGYLDIKRKEKRERELYTKLLEYEMPEKESDSVKLARTNLKINIDELKFSAKISEGAGGVVYKGTWYHQTVAIKKLKVANEQSFVREVSVLNRLRHPNVLELYGYCIDSKGYQYIITEFMDKWSLDSMIYNNGLRDFESKIKSLLDICHGMKYLHERKIMHRDLKPQNVLVNKNNVCKLCDFGLAKALNETLTVGVIGTWQYMAPEIMNESEAYNEKCDVYSFGVIMHEIFTLSKPYILSTSEYVNQFTLGMKILNGHRPSIPQEIFSKEYTEETVSHIKEYFFKTNELSSDVSNINIVNIVKIYFELCASCWSSRPSERPMFEYIITKIQYIQTLLHNMEDEFVY